MNIKEAVEYIDNKGCPYVYGDCGEEAWETLKSAVLAQQTPTALWCHASTSLSFIATV